MIKESLVQVLVAHKVKSGNASLMVELRHLGDVVADLPMFTNRCPNFIRQGVVSIAPK